MTLSFTRFGNKAGKILWFSSPLEEVDVLRDVVLVVVVVELLLRLERRLLVVTRPGSGVDVTEDEEEEDGVE